MNKILIIIPLLFGTQMILAQDEDLDLDAMWDNTVWNEIEEIADKDVQEVDNITAVAGVRGAEAEDEALHHLYYRQSMKGPSKVELNKIYFPLPQILNGQSFINKSYKELIKS